MIDWNKIYRNMDESGHLCAITDQMEPGPITGCCQNKAGLLVRRPKEIPSCSITPDEIERPKHYTRGKIEVIDFIEDQKCDFRAASALKYLCRYRFKGKPLSDLKKARWYIDRMIAELEREGHGK